MAGSPKLLVKKHFGGASIDQTTITLEEAKSQLGYFWGKDGGSNVIVSVNGQRIHSYDELAALAAQDRYKKMAVIEVGLFLSNDGTQSIWPKRE